MDTTDSKIVFDEHGVCDFCNDFKNNILPNWKPFENNTELEKIANRIKTAGKGKKYDCIIGFSGGVDSSYLLYVAKVKMGLNPLAYVVDTGWNLDVANENINTIVKKLGIDIITDVINWDEMNDLQLAFLKSQVPYQDLPQDHAIFASLYNFAVKNNIKYVLTGANNATEYLRPPIEWVYQNDLVFIKDIHKKFGKMKLKTFPMCGMLKYRLYYPIFKGMKRVAPLNYIPYDKKNIKEFLVKELGWKPYENKHYENRFTRWYEGYYLPTKFGYDKRKCYLSNLILTGEITKIEAINELNKKPYSDEEINADGKYIAEKFGISYSDFQEIIDGENKTFEDYKNSFIFISVCTKIISLLKIEIKRFR